MRVNDSLRHLGVSHEGRTIDGRKNEHGSGRKPNRYRRCKLLKRCPKRNKRWSSMRWIIRRFVIARIVLANDR